MSLLEGASDLLQSMKGRTSDLLDRLPTKDAIKEFTESAHEHLPKRKKKKDETVEPPYQGPLFTEPGVAFVDTVSSQKLVEQYVQNALEIQAQQDAITHENGHAMREIAATCGDGVETGSAFVNTARIEETAYTRAVGNLNGINTGEVTKLIFETSGRVSGLQSLDAEVQAEISRDQARIDLRYKAEMVTAVQAQVDAQFSAKFSKALRDGNPYPPAPAENTTAQARKFVRELWERLQTIPVEANDTTNVSPNRDRNTEGVGRDSPTSIDIEEEDTLDTWARSELDHLGLPTETIGSLTAHLYFLLDQRNVATRHLDAEEDVGPHSSVAVLVRTRIDQELTNIHNLPEVLQMRDALDAVVAVMTEVRDANPEARAQVGRIFSERIDTLLVALPAPAEGDEVDTTTQTERQLLEAIVTEITIYSNPNSDIKTVGDAIEAVAQLVQLAGERTAPTPPPAEVRSSENERTYRSEMTIPLTLTIPTGGISYDFPDQLGTHTAHIGLELASSGLRRIIVRIDDDPGNDGFSIEPTMRNGEANPYKGTKDKHIINSELAYAWGISRDPPQAELETATPVNLKVWVEVYSTEPTPVQQSTSASFPIRTYNPDDLEIPEYLRRRRIPVDYPESNDLPPPPPPPSWEEFQTWPGGKDPVGGAEGESLVSKETGPGTYTMTTEVELPFSGITTIDFIPDNATGPLFIDGNKCHFETTYRPSNGGNIVWCYFENANGLCYAKSLDQDDVFGNPSNVIQIGEKSSYTWKIEKISEEVKGEGEDKITKMKIRIVCDVTTKAPEVGVGVGTADRDSINMKIRTLWHSADAAQDRAEEISLLQQAKQLALSLNDDDTVAGIDHQILFAEIIQLDNQLDNKIITILETYKSGQDITGFLEKASTLSSDISELYEKELKHDKDRLNWRSLSALATLYHTVMNGLVESSRHKDVITVALQELNTLRALADSVAKKSALQLPIAYLSDAYKYEGEWQSAIEAIEENVALNRTLRPEKPIDPDTFTELEYLRGKLAKQEAEKQSLQEGLSSNPKEIALEQAVTITALRNEGESISFPITGETGASLSIRYVPDRTQYLVSIHSKDGDITPHTIGAETGDVYFEDLPGDVVKYRFLEKPTARLLTVDNERVAAKITLTLTKVEGAEGEGEAAAEEQVESATALTQGMIDGPAPETSATIFEARLHEAIKGLPVSDGVKARIKGPLEILFVGAGTAVDAEMNILKRAEAIALAANIPFVSEAVRAIAELVQAAYSVRNAGTGQITPESLAAARGHLVNWIEADLKGMVGLAEIAGMPEVAALSTAIQAGDVDRNLLAATVVKSLVNRLRTQHTANRVVVAICDVLDGLLSESGEQGILTQVANALAQTEGFAEFVNRLKTNQVPSATSSPLPIQTPAEPVKAPEQEQPTVTVETPPSEPELSHDLTLTAAQVATKLGISEGILKYLYDELKDKLNAKASTIGFVTTWMYSERDQNNLLKVQQALTRGESLDQAKAAMT